MKKASWCLVVGSVLLAGCSSAPTSRIDYKEARTLPSLEIPPNLVPPQEQDQAAIPRLAAAAQSAAEDAQGPLLPQVDGLRIERDYSRRWLVIDQPAETLWPQLQQFWATLGLSLERQDPQLGIMVTAWAENRADAPGGFLTGLVRSVFKNAYSAGTRDQYRLRLERREDGGTELYLSHYGLQEQIAAQQTEIVTTAWTIRPSDPELVDEMLNRLIVHLGGDKAEAAELLAETVVLPDSPRARREGDGVLVMEPYSRAWRRTGIALDQIGLVVEDRDRSAGIYYVSRVEQVLEGEQSQGWFRRLFASERTEEGPQTMQVLVSAEGDGARISLRDSQGEALVGEQVAPLLQKLADSLK